MIDEGRLAAQSSLVCMPLERELDLAAFLCGFVDGGEHFDRLAAFLAIANQIVFLAVQHQRHVFDGRQHF